MAIQVFDIDGDLLSLTGEQGEDRERFCSNHLCPCHIEVAEGARRIVFKEGLSFEARERVTLYLRAVGTRSLSSRALVLCDVCAEAATMGHRCAQ